MFRWVRGWHHGMTARELAQMISSILLLTSFIFLASVVLWTHRDVPPVLRWVAGVGLVSLIVRAVTAWLESRR
jgi:hypothetical protein